MYDYAVSPIRANNAAMIVALRSAKYIYANATRWDRSIASQIGALELCEQAIALSGYHIP